MAGGAEQIAMWAGAIVAVVAAVEALRRAARWLRAAWRAGVELVDHVREVHDAVTTQLLPNGGSSLVDRMGDVEAQLEQGSQRFARIERRLGIVDPDFV